MLCRYQVYCQGRLLKVTLQVEVPEFGTKPGEPVPTVNSSHFWKIDESEVAADVAQAMLAKYGETA